MSGLRKAILGIGAAVLALALIVFAVAGVVPGVFGLACWALFLVVALVIERWRYKAILDGPPGPDWRANGEQFVDPESGRRVAVFEHPASGRRAYVAAD